MRLRTTTTGTGSRHVGFVHGLGGSSELWQPLTEYLLETGQYTVTTVDLRGHGESARASSYTLEDFAGDLAESLPIGLDALVGHSLGGSVLVRAVEQLQPARVIYLDPGFRLNLPTTGIAGRLFWLAPTLCLGVAGLVQARRGARVRAGYSPEIRASLARSRSAFDTTMASAVFKDVAHSPLPVAPPAVPSTIILSEESPAVLPDDFATELQNHGWHVCRLPGVHHDMHLEAPHQSATAIINSF